MLTDFGTEIVMNMSHEKVFCIHMYINEHKSESKKYVYELSVVLHYTVNSSGLNGDYMTKVHSLAF